MLHIYNTMTGNKEEFTPLIPGRVQMYVCGITPYAPSHIGHARCYVAFDVVYRWLKRRYDVTYVRNYTDVDDKIIRAAAAGGETPPAIAARFIAQFKSDVSALGCAPPSDEPRV